jgi:hypothetical protein
VADKGKSARTPTEARAERLAAELRANLKKRKTAARGQAAGCSGPSGAGAAFGGAGTSESQAQSGQMREPGDTEPDPNQA